MIPHIQLHIDLMKERRPMRGIDGGEAAVVWSVGGVGRTAAAAVAKGT
jgi:hypothetical protein